MNSGVLATSLALMVVTSWGSQGCSNKRGPQVFPSSRPASQPPSAHPDTPGFHYPPARWRLATPDALDHATLWLGEIVIRHEGSQAQACRVPGWRPDPPNPKRTLAGALALAEKLQTQAALAPDTFERLAREYSEDVVTRDQGGMLGGVRASQLTRDERLRRRQRPRSSPPRDPAAGIPTQAVLRQLSRRNRRR